MRAALQNYDLSCEAHWCYVSNVPLQVILSGRSNNGHGERLAGFRVIRDVGRFWDIHPDLAGPALQSFCDWDVRLGCRNKKKMFLFSALSRTAHSDHPSHIPVLASWAPNVDMRVPVECLKPASYPLADLVHIFFHILVTS